MEIASGRGDGILTYALTPFVRVGPTKSMFKVKFDSLLPHHSASQKSRFDGVGNCPSLSLRRIKPQPHPFSMKNGSQQGGTVRALLETLLDVE
jgi:hypothetical protein